MDTILIGGRLSSATTATDDGRCGTSGDCNGTPSTENNVIIGKVNPIKSYDQKEIL